MAKNKYGAVQDFCPPCGRWHRSKAEATRAHELFLMEKAKVIRQLQHEPMWVLSKTPKITYKADFQYVTQEGQQVVEDVKGILTRETRVKLAWLKEKYGVDVNLIRTGRQHER